MQKTAYVQFSSVTTNNIFKGPLGSKGQKGEPSTIAGPQGPKGAAGEKVTGMFKDFLLTTSLTNIIKILILCSKINAF